MIELTLLAGPQTIKLWLKCLIFTYHNLMMKLYLWAIWTLISVIMQ